MTHRLLVLAEGNPETLDSWSGSSLHLVRALRAAGAYVAGHDVSERGLGRIGAIMSSWSPSRRRWAARYHFGPAGFRARTRRARQALHGAGAGWDGVLQIGATFNGWNEALPLFVYCDANVRVAEANRPYGDVPLLTAPEISGVAGRERSVYSKAAHVFTMSEFVRRSMIRDFAVPESSVTTVYAGANLDPASCKPRRRSPSAPPTVLFIGRHWEPKGGPVLLEAFRQARSSLPDLRLRLAGCTPPVADMPGVEVVGPLDKNTPGGLARMHLLYEQADLFCMPSRFDAFGIVFVEAMLHAVACIGSTHAAMPEIIEHDVTGWVVPVGDVGSLRDYLLRAFSATGALDEMGRRGRDRAMRLFTWDAVVAQMGARLFAPRSPDE